MFRKLNKPQLTKMKQHNFIGIRAFDSRTVYIGSMLLFAINYIAIFWSIYTAIFI
jgi:beta-N-acetylglucosaminidase